MIEPRDHKLSMRISPRSRDAERNDGLRSLLVHRLTEGAKAVWRRALGNEEHTSLYCEPCEKWTVVNTDPPTIWQCSHCDREYRIEFAVYEELE
jgi:hypothetical protein